MQEVLYIQKLGEGGRGKKRRVLFSGFDFYVVTGTKPVKGVGARRSGIFVFRSFGIPGVCASALILCVLYARFR